MTQKKDYGPVLARPCTMMSALKTCLSPTHSSAGCSSLGTENVTLLEFSSGVYVLWISFPALSSTSKVVSIFFKSSAPNWIQDSSWALTSVGIVLWRLWAHVQPSIVFSFFPFQLCNSSTLPVHVQPEIHSNLYPFLKSCCPTGCSPASIWCQQLQGHSSVSSTFWSTHHHCSLCAPKKTKVPLQCWFTKGTKLCVVFHQHTVQNSGTPSRTGPISAYTSPLFICSIYQEQGGKPSRTIFLRLKHPILCPCSV